MLRGTGRELTNQRSKMRVLPAPGCTRTYTGRKAILRMPRIGTSVRASLRAAVRSRRNGLRLQKLSSANVTAGENLADGRPMFCSIAVRIRTSNSPSSKETPLLRRSSFYTRSRLPFANRKLGDSPLENCFHVISICARRLRRAQCKGLRRKCLSLVSR